MTGERGGGDGAWGLGRTCGRVGLALCLAGAAGCRGDDGGDEGGSETGEGPTIAELEGFWRIEAIEVAEVADTEGASDAPPTWIAAERSGAPRSIRGSAEVIALTEEEATLHVRYALLDGGLPDRMPGEINAAIARDGDRLVVSPVDAGAHVYRIEPGALALALTFEPDDPRNGAGAPTLPRLLDLRRVPTPSRDPVGTWRLLSMILPEGQTVGADACAAVDGGLWERYSYGLDVDRYYGMERKASVDVYEDELCSLPWDSLGDLHVGVAEEEGARLRTWLYREEGGGLLAEAATFAVQRVDDTMTLALEGCDPRPDCEANLPLSVTVVLTGL